MQHRGLRYTSWWLAFTLLALAGCGNAKASTLNSTATALPKTGGTTINVPAGDRFHPFVTQFRHGAIVTFHNGDTDAHTITSTPDDASAFDVHLDPGATVTLKLAVPGAYRYYCSIHAGYDPQTGQIAAKSAADHPDEPMAGVLVAL